MAKDKKSFKDNIPGTGFKDTDVGWTKDAPDDKGRRDERLRGEDPNAGLGIFSWFDLNDTTNQEILLWSEWLTESNKAFGGDILYYRLSHIGTNQDQLYGEDQLERFGRPRRCKALFEDIHEPNRFWSSFGMMSDDVFTMTIPKEEYSNKIDSTGVPRVGDVIKTTWNNINYEVIYIHDHPVMAYTSSLWSFTLKRFEFTYQEGAKSKTDVEGVYQGSKDQIIIDTTMAELGGADNLYIEEESDKIVNYSDYPNILDSDIYGEY